MFYTRCYVALITMIAINISSAGCNISKEIELIKNLLSENGYDVNLINEDKTAPITKNIDKKVNIIADYSPWMA